MKDILIQQHRNSKLLVIHKFADCNMNMYHVLRIPCIKKALIMVHVDQINTWCMWTKLKCQKICCIVICTLNFLTSHTRVLGSAKSILMQSWRFENQKNYGYPSRPFDNNISESALYSSRKPIRHLWFMSRDCRQSCS